jgi:hypothetical protein
VLAPTKSIFGSLVEPIFGVIIRFLSLSGILLVFPPY